MNVVDRQDEEATNDGVLKTRMLTSLVSDLGPESRPRPGQPDNPI